MSFIAARRKVKPQGDHNKIGFIWGVLSFSCVCPFFDLMDEQYCIVIQYNAKVLDILVLFYQSLNENTEKKCSDSNAHWPFLLLSIKHSMYPNQSQYVPQNQADIYLFLRTMLIY